ncbi:TKL protein kinase, variant [Salpingoeca rosetta]|uniref:TKL protein kinase, variant n=1 Tax=Salpingoeca rosetta (strain ATCC 50818 / BSB-021) TaxID=946362 RepID=F2UN73_SALR5|nr:TKL protein kinase, variant [Salpingoeca rosetta]EGD78571.1 TKL protein kinase, variant [Salpingoeca rosetta]|eukprot:XP_004989520.1 TKL protein kinase, variant [Salpingoeca rosetta]
MKTQTEHCGALVGYSCCCCSLSCCSSLVAQSKEAKEAKRMSQSPAVLGFWRLQKLLLLALPLLVVAKVCVTNSTVLSDTEAVALCKEVDTTLQHIQTTLHQHDVPCTSIADRQHDTVRSADRRNNSNNGTAHNRTHGKKTPEAGAVVTVDLSSIQRMMAAFGCSQAERARTLSTQAQSSHPEETAVLLPETNLSKKSNPAALHSTPPPQRRRARVRRNDEPVVQAGQCTLQSVIDGSCPGANGESLVLTLFESDPARVNDSTDASTLLRISPSVRALTLSGHVEHAAVQWILGNGNWTACTTVFCEGVQFATFELSVLNPMSRLGTIWIRNSVLLREVAVVGFLHGQGITTFRVENCSLTNVPELSAMASLTLLSVDQNRIGHVSRDDLTGLASLQQLGLAQNIICHVESGAFQDLTQLRQLFMGNNDISTLPSGLLHRLSRLTTLHLHRNPIRRLRPGVFSALTALETLVLENTLLTSLPPTLFGNSTRLNLLALSGNLITSLPEAIFSGLSVLERLLLFSNRLTSLPRGVFRDLKALRMLDLFDNQLRSLPNGLLQCNTRLISFFCKDNRLTALPSNLFINSNSLEHISFANNALRSIDNVLGAAPLPSLGALDLDDNQITSLNLSTTAPSLWQVSMSGNPVEELPDISMTPALHTFRLQGHHVNHINLAAFLALSNLVVLELDASEQAKSRAVLTETNIASVAPLSALRIENVDISAVVPLIERLPTLNLHVLHVGWSGATIDTLPISALCKLLARDVRELRIVSTDYRTIELCPGKTFETLVLTNNKYLQSLTVHNPLRELNASGCWQLASIDAPPIDILDISNTRFPPTAALCTRWGRRVLFARNLAGLADTQHAATMMRNCVNEVDVLDLSGNTWLGQLAEINRVAERRVALSDAEFRTADLVVIPNRPIPPILQLTNAPIECALQLSNQDLRPLRDLSTLTPHVVFSFHCTCARGFKAAATGRCVGANPDVAGIAAGSVIGGLALGLLMAWLSRRYRGLTKRIGLQEQLLVERDEEVMALKKAWEIEYDELRMIKRVAAGAFGVVFKAEWDTVTVAVKVLQQGVMMFDESTVLEFEKEVEFLQRTRHPNVVRFFGAGTDPNGSPFLVLEFVALGSLKDLLGKDMEQVLREVRNKDVEKSSNGSVGDDVNSVWDLKLRLLRDVASGMAFIHSLDQMHRDLKSGNVLVSSSLRAKITDFGSIRQCFTRDRNQHKQRTRLSSTHDVDDPQYSPQAGLQTMTSMTLTAGVGTPLYMAPEALTGDKYSFEADIFSFGVLMWEVTTQRVPDLIEQEKGSGYRGPILATISNLMADGKRLRFEDGEQDAIPEWFQSLTYKCMAQDPRERPSFGELKDHHFA